MIEIINNKIVLNDIEPLLSNNPISAIFNSLREIWNADFIDLKENYKNGEELSKNFETMIYSTFSEIYDMIIFHAQGKGIIQETLLKNKFCLVIMDGMSMREVPLLLSELSHLDIEYNYSYSGIPSTTEAFTKKYFDANSPSTIKDCVNYKFHHLMREDRISEISIDDDKLLIWSVQPDKSFTHFTSKFEIQDLASVSEITSRITKKLIEHLENHDEIIITSDHGYFIDLYSWEGIKDFPSSDRYSNEIPKFLKKYCKLVNDTYVIIGRYNTIKKGKYVHTRHGGLSFLETIIPYLRIKTR